MEWLLNILGSKDFWVTIIAGLILLFVGWVFKMIHDNRKNLSFAVKRVWLIIFPIKFNVALIITPEIGENLDVYSREVKKKFGELISQNNLQRHIFLRDISEIIEFKSAQEAENFVETKNLDLLIWGGFTSDLLQRDGVNVTRLNLQFTYRLNDDKENQIKKALALDISSRMALKNYWEIVSKNSFTDVQLVSDNLFDVATYILALSLKFTGKIAKSLSVIEALYLKLTQRGDPFAQYVIDHVLDCYRLLIIDHGINRKMDKLAVEYCEKYLSYKPDDFFALSNLALFQYRSGNKQVAEELVRKLQNLYSGSSITKVDVAFIRILQKNYEAAYKHYNDLSAFRFVEFNTQEVVEFLFQEYEINNDPAFLYAVGILSLFFGDKELGKKTLEEFYSKADPLTYKKMRLKTERLLGVVKN